MHALMPPQNSRSSSEGSPSPTIRLVPRIAAPRVATGSAAAAAGIYILAGNACAPTPHSASKSMNRPLNDGEIDGTLEGEADGVALAAGEGSAGREPWSRTRSKSLKSAKLIPSSYVNNEFCYP